VRLVKTGLGRAASTVTLYAPAGRAADGARNEGQATIYPREGVAQARETIAVVTLDDSIHQLELTRLDIVKIDVEGSELDVLQGAEQTLKRFRPALILEVTHETSRAAGYEPSALLEFVRTLGYRVDGIGRNGERQPVADDERVAAQHRDIFCYP
jgi:hypothetical protein